MYQISFERPCSTNITATYTIFNREHDKDILTLLKFTLNKYRPLTVMYRISFDRPCSKSITATYTIFNWEHAGVAHVNMCEFRSKEY